MNTLLAFIKKEILELLRTGKLLLLVIISCLFGIMNPLIAKITPWLMESLSSQLAETGMQVGQVKIDVFTSWTQFYKNVPMLLIIFVIILSSALTIEYQKGTLINILTKGLQRWKVIIAKAIAMIALWSICYWLCFAITYGYNIYFWDNSMATHVFLGAFNVYLLGVWFISLILLVSSLMSTSYAVIGGVGGIFMIIYLLSIIPSLQTYLPLQLLNSMDIITGAKQISDYVYAIAITGGTTVLSLILATLFFNKKAL